MDEAGERSGCKERSVGGEEGLTFLPGSRVGGSETLGLETLSIVLNYLHVWGEGG